MQKHLLLTIAMLGCMFSASAFTVVLDAGHGGHDAGAVGAFSKEKNINLKYALAVGDLIKKNNPDVKVIYTRNKDVFVNLNERARIANRAKADLFISIHTNAAKNREAKGMETFTLGVSRSKENMEVAMLENSVILLEDDYEKKYEGFDPNSTDSYIMFEFMKDQYMDRSISCAELIQKNMIAASNRNNRGVRQAGFLVLRATTMPSVLIELGFISNKEEEKYLNNSKNQDKICKAIYQAFADYKHEIDKRNGKAEAEEVSNEQQTTSNKPQEATSNEQQTTSKSNQTEFYWQVLVSKNKYELNNAVFKGTTIGNVINENQVYKYLVGPVHSMEEIEQQRNQIKTKFPDAFIVVYQNGKRIAYQSENKPKQ